MGILKCGLLAALLVGGSVMAQDANPQPGAIDPVTGQVTNTPTLPATVAPEVDPNLPATLPPDNAALPVEQAAPVTQQPAPAPKPKPKKVAPAIPSVRGKVAALDKNGMTVTVDVKGKDQLFKVNSKTRIFADGKPAIFADGKVGENVTVEYRNAKDKSKEALNVRFGTAAIAAPKAAAKPAKKAAKAPKKKVDEHAGHDHSAVSTPAPTPETNLPAAVPATPVDPANLPAAPQP